VGKNRVFGRFITRGVQKHDFFPTKIHWAHHKECGFFFLRFFFFSLGCFARFFLSRFWAFRNKGNSKTRLKKSQKFFRSRQKTHLLPHVTFFFLTPPLVPGGRPSVLGARLAGLNSVKCCLLRVWELELVVLVRAGGAGGAGGWWWLVLCADVRIGLTLYGSGFVVHSLRT
jgi:hypothetical protein